MTDTNNKPHPLQHVLIQHFLTHQWRWGAALLVGWFGINVLILASTKLMEIRRSGETIPTWEPFCWEISSCVVLLLLIPLVLWLNDRWVSRLGLKARFLVHIVATVPFSILHVTGMVTIRHLWYQFMDASYNFGDLPVEFFYEYRKDAQAYLTLALIITGYRFIVRRLQGEASYLADSAESETSEPEAPPERLLIKKLGREFLVQTSDIEWIEASGNYANLHIKDTVYPMRITMDKLEKLLPSNFTRIHRSTIINLTQVQEIQALDSGDYQVTLRNHKNLTLSRRYRESFKTLLSLS
jgi:hypothetical protein